MPTIEQLREAFPIISEMADDELMQSPWFHLGILSSSLPDGDRRRLSLDLIGEALRDVSERESL